jgi:hypothetical protein
MYPVFPGWKSSTPGAVIAPPQCTQTLPVGSSCSAEQPGFDDDFSFTSGLSSDGHNYLTMRNIGNTGCIEKGSNRFLAAGQERDNLYNVGGTQTWEAALDKKARPAFHALWHSRLTGALDNAGGSRERASRRTEP